MIKWIRTSRLSIKKSLSLHLDATPWALRVMTSVMSQREREFFIDNLLVRIHVIIVMIRWTGLAPWEYLDATPWALRVVTSVMVILTLDFGGRFPTCEGWSF